MNTSARKQREFAAREQLILDCTARLLAAEGYQGLSMDKVAAAVEYSKGTIYQHFACKEDLLAGLCLRSMGDLHRLFARAAALEWPSRERLLALSFAYELFLRSHPVEFANMQTLKSATVREKAAAARRQCMHDMEARIMDAVTQCVRDAVAGGDLVLPRELNSEALVFGLWATQFGAMSLRVSGIPFPDYGIADTAAATEGFTRALLDGLGWRPLASDFDYSRTRRALEHDVFAAEVQACATTNEGTQT